MNPELVETTKQYLKTLHRLGQETVLLDRGTIKLLGEYSKTSDKPADLSTFPKKLPRPNFDRVKTETMQTSDEPLPVFQTTGDKDADMAALRERALACMKCPHLVRTRKNVVFGVGSINAQIMFIGEAPGADEDTKGEPFVGRAGELLTKMIQAMGLGREDVYIANVLKCRPDMPANAPGNRKPTPKEMSTCLPYLRAQINLIRPQVMITLGSTALEGLLGTQKISMTGVRGKWQEFEGIPFMPTYHPAYLLRNQTNQTKRMVWEDLLAVMERVNMKISDKQRSYFLK
jgi:DNA polymerase